jgi:hypothetical protein
MENLLATPLYQVLPQKDAIKQDERCDFNLLSRLTQLNILVHNVATDALMDFCAAGKTA